MTLYVIREGLLYWKLIEWEVLRKVVIKSETGLSIRMLLILLQVEVVRCGGLTALHDLVLA